MEKFVVSARKYRPQNFNTVVGQEHITTTLKNAIHNNQLAHAFLFCGPRGVGKTTCARILAKTINCENRTPDDEACNECTSCISFENGSSLNIHELDAASNNSVDDIRALVEQVRFVPQAGQYKVYIIDEVHMLTSQAFNAFLKTLEEPPSYAIFILATTEKHKILPTILSRCQIFDFKRITIKDIVDHLADICAKENVTFEKSALHLIAQKSEGCMRDALSIMDKISSFTDRSIDYANTLEHLNILDEDYYFKILDFNTSQKLSDALLLFDHINQKGFEGDIFIEGYAEFVRNLLISADQKALSLLDVAEDFKPRYLETSKTLSPQWMIAALNILSESGIGYKQARNKRLFVELMLIKLSYLSQAVELSEEASGISKKKLADRSVSLPFRTVGIRSLGEQRKSSAPKPQPAASVEIIEEKHPQLPAVKVSDPVAEEPQPYVQAGIPASATPAPSALKPKAAGGIGLSRLRDKSSAKKDKAYQELTLPVLQELWKELGELESLTPSVSGAMRLAKVDISGPGNFTIGVQSVLQQRFIESERNRIVAKLQQVFGLGNVTYDFRVDESAEQHPERQLTAKEKFERMAEANPLLRELKDELGLELS